MFLLGATTRGYLRTAHRVAIRNVPLCPPHVLRNRAGESALDAVFEVGGTNAGQSEPDEVEPAHGRAVGAVPCPAVMAGGYCSPRGQCPDESQMGWVPWAAAAPDAVKPFDARIHQAPGRRLKPPLQQGGGP